jgi:hypothetical protein
VSGRIDGPWRSWPILGGLYAERKTGRRVEVINVSSSDTHVIIIRVDNGSNRHTKIRGESLLDENRWHFLGISYASASIDSRTEDAS